MGETLTVFNQSALPKSHNVPSLMGPGAIKTVQGLGSLLSDCSCAEFIKKKNEERKDKRAKLPNVWLFVIKFMVIHACSELMDTQWHRDLIALISCTRQTKCPRFAQRMQGRKREERIFDLVSTWKQAVRLLITPLYSTSEQSCTVQRGALYISSLRKAIYRRGVTLPAPSYFLLFEMFFRCWCSSVAVGGKKTHKCLQRSLQCWENCGKAMMALITSKALRNLLSRPKLITNTNKDH